MKLALGSKLVSLHKKYVFVPVSPCFFLPLFGVGHVCFIAVDYELLLARVLRFLVSAARDQ